MENKSEYFREFKPFRLDVLNPFCNLTKEEGVEERQVRRKEKRQMNRKSQVICYECNLCNKASEILIT